MAIHMDLERIMDTVIETTQWRNRSRSVAKRARMETWEPTRAKQSRDKARGRAGNVLRMRKSEVGSWRVEECQELFAVEILVRGFYP